MSDEGPHAERSREQLVAAYTGEPVVRVLEHRLTCESVPTQIEGEFVVRGLGRLGYYFRYRFGRWSLSVGPGPELTSEWDEVAAGIGGFALPEERNYDGLMDIGLASELIDSVLAAWASRIL